MRYRVFAYGTLMFPAIAAAVAGERPPCEPARLHDHARHALHRRVYPGAVQRAGHAVDGVLYHDLTPAALAHIDAFEGELYRRHRVTVVAGPEERPCDALVYLVRPRFRSLLLGHDWCIETFRRDWHERYLRRCGVEFPHHAAASARPGPSRR